MTTNREMFRKIGTLISEFPELHHQGSWEADPKQHNTCGTTRCIAGWAVWLKACELELISRKRDEVDSEMLEAVATHLKVDIRDASRDSQYEILGTAILGLDRYTASSLFYDMHQERVIARVRSYAEHGHDLTDEEINNWS